MNATFPSGRPGPDPGPLRLIAGGLVAAGVAALLVALLLLIGLAAGTGAARPPDIARILVVSFLQAGVTTLLSLLLGVAIAWAFNRLRFFGRGTAIGLMSAALVTPGLVVAFGLITVWGRAGWINSLVAPFGLSLPPLFGFWGIVFAHVVLDASFAAALILPRLDGLPATRLRLGQSLALTPRQRFAILDWPALKPVLPGLGAIIFLLAFTSFPVVLTLGGGPANQTLEVAIYAAVRLDFDLGAAVRLALVQLAVASLLILPATALSLVPPAAGALRAARWPEPAGIALLAAAILALTALLFGLPLAAVLAGAAQVGDIFFTAPFRQALTTSLMVGTASAGLALTAGLAVALARAATRNPFIGLALAAPEYAYLAMPGVTLALGFFLLVRVLGLDPGGAGLPVLMICGALLALPYAVSTLTPALAGARSRYGRLSSSLRLTSWQRWRHVEWPLVGREVGLVLAIGFCFSLGDLGVISLFGTENLTTLSWAMQRAMGAYRTDDAAAIAALMLVLCITVFTAVPPLFERLSRA